MGLAVPSMETAVPLVGVHVALKLVAVAPVLAAVKFTLDTVSPEEALTRLGAKGMAGLVSVLAPEAEAVTVTELVGWEHSMKNELIIAKYTGQQKQSAADRLKALLTEFGLEALLKIRFSHI